MAGKTLDISTCRSRGAIRGMPRAATRPTRRIPRIRGGAASGKWHKGRAQRAILLAGDMRGRACVPLPHVLCRGRRPRSFEPEAEVEPCWRNGAVRFVISGLRTNGLPKTGKSMRYNSRTGVRQPMPFRKHQVDCLHPWRLPSHGKLLRRLLAIFNIRTGAKRPEARRRAVL